MGGTRAGGRKAAETNKKKYGEDFYRNNGRKGGRISTTGGFYARPELAREAGSVGGARSKRWRVYLSTDEKGHRHYRNTKTDKEEVYDEYNNLIEE